MVGLLMGLQGGFTIVPAIFVFGKAEKPKCTTKEVIGLSELWGRTTSSGSGPPEGADAIFKQL